MIDVGELVKQIQEVVMAVEDKKEVTKTADKGMQGKTGRALSPFEEMEHMFDSFFGQPWPRRFMRPFQFDWGDLPAPFEGRPPKVDVINRDNDVVIKAELPGVKKEDLDVSLSDNSLTIRASTKHEETEEEGEYHRRELSRGEFVRTLTLPAEVDGSKAKASFKDGLLELTVPKNVAAKRHTVEID